MNPIAAISTPRGEGGIAVLRLSGDGVFSVAEKVFDGIKKPSEMSGYSCTFGHITDGEKNIDECVLTVFRKPNSYTGEDVIEFSVHGGDYTAKKTLSLLIKNGARAARAGEFTERAVLSGKLTLTQAEAVIDIIKARAEKELILANAMKDGAVLRLITKAKDELVNLGADIGVCDDYPDDYGEVSCDDIIKRTETALSTVKKLTDGYAAGSLIKSGIPVVITGKPNAGKSSIMNLLSGQNRSIVTDIPGTTRDTIDGYITLSGYTLKLTDTAGLRETGDLAEKIGVERALEAVKTAAITLAVFDLGRTADENDELTLKNCETGQTIIIFNKTDEERALPDDFINALSEKHPTVFLSAKSGEGLSELKESLAKKLEENIMLSDTEAVLNERQFAAASAAEAALTRVVSAAKENAATDIISVLIFEATEHLSSLTGESVTESVADEIFSRFCVGK